MPSPQIRRSVLTCSQLFILLVSVAMNTPAPAGYGESLIMSIMFGTGALNATSLTAIRSYLRRVTAISPLACIMGRTRLRNCHDQNVTRHLGAASQATERPISGLQTIHLARLLTLYGKCRRVKSPIAQKRPFAIQFARRRALKVQLQTIGMLKTWGTFYFCGLTPLCGPDGRG